MTIFEIIFILVICKIFAFRQKPFELSVCYDNSSTLDKHNNEPRVVDVTTGSTVHLWCHYCNGKEHYYPRLWFYKPRGIFFMNQVMKEIQTTENNAKVSISLSHTLSIYDFKPNNSGLYTCRNYEDKRGIFTYVLDGIINVEVKSKIGSARQWQEYKRIYIDSINMKFKISEEEPYKTFRNKYGIILKVFTIWDNWSECKETNDNPKRTRKRLGRCRVGFMAWSKDVPSNIVTSYLNDGYDVPCRSIKLNELVPEISSVITKIPEFEAEEICPVSQKAEKSKKKGMHKITQQVMENSHVILMCTEVVPNSNIKWYKEKKLLKSIYGDIFNKRDDEPRISIDANNTLHLLRISKTEEGIYTCSINGKKIRQFEVQVVSKSKWLNQEFIRYSIYLGFVLSLTMTCYCAGVCVAWHRRASFVDPLNLYKKIPGHYSRRENEKLLG